MDKSREKLIEVFAKDDAKWDKCFVDLNTLGYVKNFKVSAYSPPKDPEEKKTYDYHWNKMKEKK